MGPILVEGQVARVFGTAIWTVKFGSFKSGQGQNVVPRYFSSKATLQGCPDCGFRPPRHLGFHWYIRLLLPLEESNKSNLALCHKDYKGYQKSLGNNLGSNLGGRGTNIVFNMPYLSLFRCHKGKTLNTTQILHLN